MKRCKKFLAWAVAVTLVTGMLITQAAPALALSGIPLPLGAWNLNEGKGTALCDVSGREATGSVTDSAAWVDDATFTKVLQSNGSGRLGLVERGYNLSAGFSIAGWVNVPAGSGETPYRYVIKTENAGAGDWNIHINPKGEIVMESNNAASWGRGFAVENRDLRGAGWTHFSFQYDAGAQKLYIYLNGACVSELNWEKTIPAPAAGAKLSFCEGQGPLTKLAYVRLFDRSLTSGQVDVLKNRTEGLTIPDEFFNPQSVNLKDGLLAGWNFAASAKEIFGNVTGENTFKAIPSKYPVWQNDEAAGKVFDFANNQFLVVDGSAPLGTAFTVAGKLKAPASDGTGSRVILANGTKDQAGYWEVAISPEGRLAIRGKGWSEGFHSGSIRVDDNAWHQFAFRYDGAAMTVRIDDNIAATAEGACPSGTAGQLTIGNYNGSEMPYNGYLRNVRIYTRCINSAENNKLFKSGDGLADVTVYPADVEMPAAAAAWNLNREAGSLVKGYATEAAKAPSFVFDDFFGSAMEFKDNQYLKVDGAYVPGNAFSVSGWVKLSAAELSNGAEKTILSNGAKTDADFWKICVTPEKKISFFAENLFHRGIDSDQTLVKAGEWTNFIVLYANGKMSLYINGQPAARDVAVTQNTVAPTAAFMNIGSVNNGELILGGSIAKIRIYNSTLGETDIAMLSSDLDTLQYSSIPPDVSQPESQPGSSTGSSTGGQSEGGSSSGGASGDPNPPGTGVLASSLIALTVLLLAGASVVFIFIMRKRNAAVKKS